MRVGQILRFGLILGAVATFVGCASVSESVSGAEVESAAAATAIAAGKAAGKAAAPKIAMGNGVDNAIELEGFRRSGRVFSFNEVKIDGDGWLVLHPFRDGKPEGKIYVGATFLRDGVNRDVSVKVQTAPEPTPGTRYVVMLHRDVNANETFDFVFVDERNVLDIAVFEGTTMVAHVITAP